MEYEDFDMEMIEDAKEIPTEEDIELREQMDREFEELLASRGEY